MEIRELERGNIGMALRDNINREKEGKQ